MAESKKDNNSISTILGTSNSDGSTPILVKVNPTNHALKIDNDTTGSDLSGDIASRDDNGNTVMMGVSETDGVTPVAMYADSSTGALLIDSM